MSARRELLYEDEASPSTSYQTPSKQSDEITRIMRDLNICSPKSAVKRTGHGYSYQLKLLMLQLLIAGDENYENFKLTSEVKSGEFFDDVVFQCENKIIFIQSKHSKDDKALIEPSFFFTTADNENFNLKKYFMSYETIKRKYSEHADLKFIICTNKDFKFNSKPYLKLVYKNENLIILLNKVKCDDVKLISQYGGDLYQIKSSSCIGSTRKKVKNTKEIEDLILKGFKEVEKISKRESIQRFISELIFAVNQPNDEALDKKIEEKLNEKLHLSDASLAKTSYQEMMYKWLNDKLSEPLTKLELDDFLKNTKTKILISQFTGMTKSSSAELESKLLIFENSIKLQEIKDFFIDKRKSRKKIMILTTPSSLTALGSIFVLQGIKDLSFKQGHFLFMKISSFNNFKDDFLQCITDNSVKFLVLEVDCDVNFLEIRKTISQARKAPATILKFIFIASETSKYAKNPDIKLSDLFSMLTKPSQDKLRQKIVNYKGERVELGSIDNVNVDNDLLFKLITNQVITIRSVNNVIERELKEEIHSDKEAEQ